MHIRTVHVPKNIDLSRYLLDAEKTIDSLSDEELDAFEAQLQASIQKLAQPKPNNLRSLSDAQNKKTEEKAKSKTSRRMAWPVLTGLMVAAVALMVVRSPVENQSSGTANWQTKDASKTPVTAGRLCSLTIQQKDKGSAVLTDNGYAVTKTEPVYANTNCTKDLVVEVENGNTWVTKFRAESKDGYLTKNGKLLDLGSVIGPKIRIKSADGATEVFTLTEAR